MFDKILDQFYPNDFESRWESINAIMRDDAILYYVSIFCVAVIVSILWSLS